MGTWDRLRGAQGMAPSQNTSNLELQAMDIVLHQALSHWKEALSSCVLLGSVLEPQNWSWDRGRGRNSLDLADSEWKRILELP